jgi:hypothetical protein
LFVQSILIGDARLAVVLQLRVVAFDLHRKNGPSTGEAEAAKLVHVTPG